MRQSLERIKRMEVKNIQEVKEARMLPIAGQMQKEISTESKCPICKGFGWEMYDDENGVAHARDCSCGLRTRQAMYSKLSFANIPETFKGNRLSDFRRDIYRSEESRKIIEVDCKAVDWWLGQIDRMKAEGRGLYLYSNCKGSGKTMMATAIANELIYEHGMNVKFATSVQIINEIKASWDKEEGVSEHQLLDDLAKAEVLIIDDFGIETVRDWIVEKIYQIINQRYINRKITIFTSNYSVDELTYDDRITNRIKEKSYMLAFPNESIRDYIFEMNMAELKAAIA